LGGLWGIMVCIELARQPAEGIVHSLCDRKARWHAWICC
jgi:hypothetical protein